VISDRCSYESNKICFCSAIYRATWTTIDEGSFRFSQLTTRGRK